MIFNNNPKRGYKPNTFNFNGDRNTAISWFAINAIQQREFPLPKKEEMSQNEIQNNSDHSEDRKRYCKSKESGMQIEGKKKKKHRLQFDLKTNQWISLQNTRKKSQQKL